MLTPPPLLYTSPWSIMHLTHLTLTNFRGFQQLELPIHRHLTVLVGRNGSGKTSVLDAIALPIRQVKNLKVSGKQDIRRGEKNASIQQHWGPSVHLRWDCTKQHGWNPGADIPMGIESVYFVQRSLDRAAAGEALSTARRAFLAQHAEQYPSEQTGFKSYEILVGWFREREDIENRERVRRKDLGYLDPPLEAARRAIVGFLGEGYGNPRIEHEGDETLLVIDKGGEALSGAQLSDGERSLVVIAGDLARQLAGAVAEGDPLNSYALVLIDEIELHLHPSWQRRIVPALRETFPEAQFILSTHSPQVLSEVPAESLRILENFTCLSPQHPVRGRDANAILREIMGTTERPRFVEDMILDFSRLLDEANFSEAHERLDGLRELLGDTDSEVIRAEVALSFLEQGGEHGGPS